MTEPQTSTISQDAVDELRRRSKIFALADTLAEGRLAERLQAMRAEDRSYHEIARELSADYGTDFNQATVRLWCVQLDVGTRPRGATQSVGAE